MLPLSQAVSESLTARLERASREGPPNPDPENFEIKRKYCSVGYSVVLVEYPDCTNYEGLKVLVFRAPLEEVVAMERMDPRFCEGEGLSPVARFEPTERGWDMAVFFVSMVYVFDGG